MPSRHCGHTNVLYWRKAVAVSPNVACYEVLLAQPAFLAGAAAALTTRSGVVAHLSGERVGPGIKGFEAFRAGASYANPHVKVLSQFCGNQHDPQLARHCIEQQAAAGADVVFTMLGAGRDGAIEACRDGGLWQIGDGADWCAIHPDVFLASAVADAAWCAEQAVDDLMSASLVLGGHKVMGLSSPAICRLSLGAGVSASARTQLAVWAAALEAGELTVSTSFRPV